MARYSVRAVFSFVIRDFYKGAAGELGPPPATARSIDFEISRIDSSCQVGQIFSKLCGYEDNNSPINEFDEQPAVERVPSYFVCARLLCAFAARACDLPRRLLYELQHRPR